MREIIAGWMSWNQFLARRHKPHYSDVHGHGTLLRERWNAFWKYPIMGKRRAYTHHALNATFVHVTPAHMSESLLDQIIKRNNARGWITQRLERWQTPWTHFTGHRDYERHL